MPAEATTSTNLRSRPNPSVGFVEQDGTFRDLNIKALIGDAETVGMEFVCYFIGGEERVTLDVSKEDVTVDTLPPIEVVDLQLRSSDWSRRVVGRISPWIDVDSENPRIRQLSERALSEELDYMKYLGLSAMMIDLRGMNCSNLARMLMQSLWTTAFGAFRIWMVVPVVTHPEHNGAHRSLQENGDFVREEEKEVDPWFWWFKLRSMTGNNSKLAVCLNLTADLPEDGEVMKRWMGEQVASILLDTSVFLTNKGGWPVLSRRHQNLVKDFFGLGSQGLLAGKPDHRRAAGSFQAYMDYLNKMWTERTINGELTRFAAGYEDSLQTPLQPLSTNLDSSIYEVFEEDPVKYVEYRRAIFLAMQDLVSDKAKTPKSHLVVMVLGAGRGPLVVKCIEALQEINKVHDEGVTARFYAVEKNRNAIVTLNYLKDDSWKEEDVVVIHCDMRELGKGQYTVETADIIVSELLGSFGDNELSPECLDGVAAVIGPDTVNIPRSYTSWLGPIHSPKLYANIRDDTSSPTSRTIRPAAASSRNVSYNVYDHPYVVLIHNRYEIAPAEPLFTFSHPNSERKSNNREATLSFEAKVDCELMGFAGYFQTELYKDVVLSIVPKNHSEGIWFPLVFPLRVPVSVKKGQRIRMTIWRLSDEEKVWYEWCLLEPISTKIQNAFGYSYHMKLM